MKPVLFLLFTGCLFSLAPMAVGQTNAASRYQLAAVQFPAADVAFDPVRGYAYLVGYEARTLVMLNLTNGLIERQFSFDTKPESIAISPDGRWLYVALLRRPHSWYWFGGHTNEIAEFDLNLKAKTREFEILADPGDIAVTDRGILIVTGGSDQNTDIRTYRAATGELLNATANRQLHRLSLHPSQDAVYSASTESSPSRLYRFSFDPIGGTFTAVWNSYHGAYEMGGNVWCDPRGTKVIARLGHVLASSPVQTSDLLYERTLAGGTVDSAAFDPGRDAVFTVGSGKLWHYNLANFALKTTRRLVHVGQAVYVHATGDRVFLASVLDTNTLLEKFPNPALPQPGILAEPEDQTVIRGNPMMLSVSASGDPPLNYQWFKGTEPLSGATTAMLLRTNVQAADDAGYFAVIGNALGATTSRVAQVQVLLPPLILKSPESTTVPVGGRATFRVEATGTPPFTYLWTFEGLNLPLETNATLTLENASPSLAGTYGVYVNNGVGSVASDRAILRVVPGLPVLTPPARELHAFAGTDPTLTVLTSGSQPIFYQWGVEGDPLPGATNASLTLTNVQFPQGGTYSVHASNLLGAAMPAHLILTVLPAVPRFVQQPEPTLGFLGGSTTISALARGSEPIEYQWRHQSTNLPDATPPTLVLTNLAGIHAGDYSVLARNREGSATSVAAALTLKNAAPEFTQHPLDQVTARWGSFVLSVAVTGADPLALQWYFKDIAMAGQTQTLFRASNVTAATSGLYYALATNSFGRTTSSVARVTVTAPPLFLPELSNLVVDAGSLVALGGNIGGAEPITYTWEHNFTVLTSARDASLTISNAHKGHAGVYRLTAANIWGLTRSSAVLTVFPRPGRVLACGDDTGGQSRLLPTAPHVVQVAGGAFHSLALGRDGTVAMWGFGEDALRNTPAPCTNVVAIAAGAYHNLAVRLDGRVFAWGNNDRGQCSVPAAANSVMGIAAGELFSLAVRRDGSLVAWGDNSFGQSSTIGLLGFAVAVAAGYQHGLALRSNGTVIAWGWNGNGQCVVPAGLTGVRAIAAGYLHSLALRADGTVVGWGDDSFGQATPPAGLSNAIAIAAGEIHSLALLADGRVVGWGDNHFGQRQVPGTWQGIVGLGAGHYHTLAISGPRLRYEASPSGLILSWDSPYVLQRSGTLPGLFEDVTGTSPYQDDGNRARQFFRLRSER